MGRNSTLLRHTNKESCTQSYTHNTNPYHFCRFRCQNPARASATRATRYGPGAGDYCTHAGHSPESPSLSHPSSPVGPSSFPAGVGRSKDTDQLVDKNQLIRVMKTSFLNMNSTSKSGTMVPITEIFPSLDLPSTESIVSFDR